MEHNNIPSEEVAKKRRAKKPINHDAQVQFKVDRNLKLNWQKHADDLGMTLSEYIRETMNLNAGRNSVMTDKRVMEKYLKTMTEFNNKMNQFITENKRVGNNINQITKMVRQGRVNDLDNESEQLEVFMKQMKNANTHLYKEMKDLWRQLE